MGEGQGGELWVQEGRAGKRNKAVLGVAERERLGQRMKEQRMDLPLRYENMSRWDLRHLAESYLLSV
jgi:hypothetical protein